MRFSNERPIQSMREQPSLAKVCRLQMRLVIKVGTSLIAPGGRIDTKQLRTLVDQLDLSHHEFLIVSSGAIAVRWKMKNDRWKMENE